MGGHVGGAVQVKWRLDCTRMSSLLRRTAPVVVSVLAASLTTRPVTAQCAPGQEGKVTCACPALAAWLTDHPEFTADPPLVADRLDVAPKRLSAPWVTYPRAAQEHGWQAELGLLLVVDTLGRVEHVEVCETRVQRDRWLARERDPRPDPRHPARMPTVPPSERMVRKLFEDAALEFARGVRFQPGLLEGVPRRTLAYEPIIYSLQRRP